MATNAGPIYGKQYIRYAETWQAAIDVEVGSPLYNANAGKIDPELDTCEIGELRVVAYASYISPAPNSMTAAGIDSFVSIPSSICGVNQAYMPSVVANPTGARQLTVATSGLLLIECEPDPPAPAPPIPMPNVNTALVVNAAGQAAPTGTAVNLDGTTPIIREQVVIGGRKLVLVSFA